MSNVTALKEQVESTQAELDAQLAGGESTIETRRKLKTAETNLHAAEQEENKKAAQAEAEVKTGLRYEAGDMIKAATDNLASQLEKFQLEKPILQLPIHIAENILIGREKLAEAQKEKQAYQSRIDKLRQRQSALEEERSGIIERRTAGRGNDEQDGQDLARIQADLEGLESLIERESNTDTLAADTTSVERAVNESQAAWNHAIRAEEVRCLRELVYKLEDLLVMAAATLASIPGIKATERYQPGPVIRKGGQDGLI